MPEQKRIKTEGLFSRALITPNSFNEEARSFDVVFATEAPCQMRGYMIGLDEDFNEILLCREGNVRTERLNDGLPVFDNHPYNKSASIQLGICSNTRFENNQLVGTITLGARADDALISDIKNGIIKGISVGYNVYTYQRDVFSPDDMPTLNAIDWEPFEVSFAPVQADTNSKIRSNNGEKHETIILNNEKKMTIEEIRAKATDEQKARLDAIITVGRSANLKDEKVVELYEGKQTIEEIRSAYKVEPKKEEPADPVLDSKTVEEIRSQATKKQSDFFDSILLSTRAAKMDDSKAIEYFKSGKPIEEIRQMVIDEFVKKDPKTISVNQEEDGTDKKRSAIQNAIMNRVSSKFKLEKNNEYRGMSLVEIGKELLIDGGVNVRGMSKNEVYQRLMKRDLSTSDFPLLLEDTNNKMLRADYGYAPEFWDKIARETSVSDFREKKMYQVDKANGMKKTPEGDKIKFNKLLEAKQTISVESYAEGLLFTRQAFVNDDLSAFSLIPNKFVQDWDLLRGDVVWGLITDNAKMDDGNTLFHTKHNNLAATGAILSEDSLSEAYVAMSTQTGLDGKKRLNIIPKYICVSAEYKIEAMKLLTSITPQKVEDVNVFSNMDLAVIVDRHLSGKAWYLTADPAAVEGLYYAYLDGNGGLRSERVEDFDTDSIKFAVRGEFGASAIDYRGWFKNPGQ